MKKLLLITLMMCFFKFTFGQTATNDEVLSKTKKGLIETYISSSGEIFKIGDTITIGIPQGGNKDFNWIKQNGGMGNYFEVTNGSSGSKVVIKKMNSVNKVLIVNTTKGLLCGFALQIFNFENAIQIGEIKTNIMSSDEALTELKKCKDKLDLGLITQEEFDKKKAELSKFIK